MKLILTALILLGASSSFAGNAANDPVIASLRARFSKASVPAAQQLNTGKTWDCREFGATRDSSLMTPHKRTFRSFDGLIEMAFNTGNYDDTFVATPQGLVSTEIYGEVIIQSTIRIDSKNNLLIERSSKAKESASKETKAEYVGFDKSIAFAGSSSTYYSVCIIK